MSADLPEHNKTSDAAMKALASLSILKIRYEIVDAAKPLVMFKGKCHISDTASDAEASVHTLKAFGSEEGVNLTNSEE